MFLRKYALSLIFAALVAATSSCTKEDTTDCFPGLRLTFSFTLHNNGGNKFGEEVNRIRVYGFDQQGVLQFKATDDTRTLTYSYLQNGELRTVTKPNPFGALPDDYVMELDVPPGKYKIVAWGGSTLNTESLFFDAQMNNTADWGYREGVTLGVTTMEDFRMFMKYNDAPGLPEDIVPVVPRIDDLWYGAYGVRDQTTSKYTMKDIVIKSGEVAQGDIELIKNTNLLKVSVTGIEYLVEAMSRAALPLDVWATAVNNCYKIDNSIGENAQSVRYTPYSEQIDGNTMLVDIKILRMDLERHRAQPVYLTISNPVTGSKFPEQPIDIVNTLMQAKDADGNYIYTSQADFDREYEHPVEIKIDFDLQVRIFIRGWEIVSVTPEV